MNYANKYEKYLEKFSSLLSQETLAKLDLYFQLLIKDALPRGFIGEAPEEVLWQRHILDSLLVLQNEVVANEFKRSEVVADLGSGAGLPGIVLSIVFPGTYFYLVEAMQKRCLFLNEAIEALGLEKIHVINKRVEDVAKMDFKKGRPDLVLYRAFLKPLVSLELSLNIIGPDSKVLYWRSRRFDISDDRTGKEIDERLQALGFRISFFENLDCPEELGTRGFYLFEYTGKSAPGFPRTWARIKIDSLGNRIT